MLRSLKDLEGYAVSATDGDIGSVVSFLLDDERWTVRYLVVDAGGFLDGRQVLISPISFRQVESSGRRFHLALTMSQVKESPKVDVNEPVSRQYEQEYHRYYGYPYYWGLPGLWGMGASPDSLAGVAWNEAAALQSDQTGDAHLRGAAEVGGYQIEGNDGAIGRVDDFIVDDETWQIRYLVIDTSSWWFGKKVLVAPQWASRVSWEEGRVYVDMTRQAIKNSPEWDSIAAVNREYELRLYDYYGRPVYWDSDDRAPGAPPPHHSASHTG